MSEEHKENTLQNKEVTFVRNGLSIAADDIIRHYQQSAMTYEDGLNRYILDINRLKKEIEHASYENEKEEENLRILKMHMYHEEKLLERFNAKFEQKIKSIEELKSEYAAILEQSEYRKLLRQKEKELLEIPVEIDEVEAKHLNDELEHLNMMLRLEPKRQHISDLENQLAILELEKDHYATTKLHQLPFMQDNTENNLDEEIVDTEVMKEEL